MEGEGVVRRNLEALLKTLSDMAENQVLVNKMMVRGE